jgi:CRISPR/Cas system-associated protein Cas5 (RAMP superfamily)
LVSLAESGAKKTLVSLLKVSVVAGGELDGELEFDVKVALELEVVGETVAETVAEIVGETVGEIVGETVAEIVGEVVLGLPGASHTRSAPMWVTLPNLEP